MNEQELFNKELDEIRENSLIELSQWWGHMYGGYSGTIITKNREVYKYQYYHTVPNSFEGNAIFINKIRDLNEEEFERINTFIKDEIIDKQYTNEIMFDAGFTVVVDYNGIKKVIENNKGTEKDLKIYDIAEKLLEEII